MLGVETTARPSQASGFCLDHNQKLILQREVSCNHFGIGSEDNPP